MHIPVKAFQTLTRHSTGMDLGCSANGRGVHDIILIFSIQSGC